MSHSQQIFFGKAELKAKYLARLEERYAMNRIVRFLPVWNATLGEGSAIGCLLESQDFSLFERGLGLQNRFHIRTKGRFLAAVESELACASSDSADSQGSESRLLAD